MKFKNLVLSAMFAIPMLSIASPYSESFNTYSKEFKSIDILSE